MDRSGRSPRDGVFHRLHTPLSSNGTYVIRVFATRGVLDYSLLMLTMSNFDNGGRAARQFLEGVALWRICVAFL